MGCVHGGLGGGGGIGWGQWGRTAVIPNQLGIMLFYGVF